MTQSRPSSLLHTSRGSLLASVRGPECDFPVTYSTEFLDYYKTVNYLLALRAGDSLSSPDQEHFAGTASSNAGSLHKIASKCGVAARRQELSHSCPLSTDPTLGLERKRPSRSYVYRSTPASSLWPGMQHPPARPTRCWMRKCGNENAECGNAEMKILFLAARKWNLNFRLVIFTSKRTKITWHYCD